mgnify:CR=1 FL=1
MNRLRVLVVDDEIYIRSAIGRTLESLQFPMPDIDETVAFTFEEAGSAEEAIEHIAKNAPPDILLLDLKLPGISGIELLEQMEDSLAETLTVMITAYASIETAVRATKSGAYDFLAKPFTPDELEQVRAGRDWQLAAAQLEYLTGGPWEQSGDTAALGSDDSLSDETKFPITVKQNDEDEEE